MIDSSSGESGVIVWPEDLPAPLIDRAHNLLPRSEVTVMESRRKRIRRLHQESIELIDVEWNFTIDQFDVFRTFFVDELGQGVELFLLVTFELSPDPLYYFEVSRMVAFVDGTYTFNQSDNLITVRGTLIVDEEETIAIPYTPEPPTPDESHYIPPVVVSYSECLDTFTLDFGIAIPGLKRFLIEHGDSESGPFEHYCYARREKTQLVFNNYFQGLKWVRVSAIWMDLSVEEIHVFQPDSALIQAPLISIPSLPAPRFAFPANYVGVSGQTGADVLVTDDSGQLDYVNAPILQIPCGEAFIEVQGKKGWEATSWSDRDLNPYPPTIESDEEDVEIRFTIDGSDPTLASLPPGTNSNPYNYDFGMVIIARCFKEGCMSPPAYFIIDKAFALTGLMGTGIKIIDGSGACVLPTYNRTPANDCVTVMTTSGSCIDDWGSDDPLTVLNLMTDSFLPVDAWDGSRTVYNQASTYVVLPGSGDLGVCTTEYSWGGGTVNFSISLVMGTRARMDSGNYAGIVASLDMFPPCFSMAYIDVGRSYDDPIDGVIYHSVSSSTYKFLPGETFFGPTGSNCLETNTTILASSIAQASLDNATSDPTTFVTTPPTYFMGYFVAIATLAPVPAADIWNPDDIT